MNKMNKILIAVPTIGQNSSMFTRAVVALKRPCNWDFEMADRLVVHMARNALCQKFLEGDYSHILFWDDDVLPPVDGLEKLFSYDRDIVMTPIINRQVGFPMVYNKELDFYNGEKHGLQGLQGLQEVGGGSIGFCLIKRPVIGKLWAKHKMYPFEFEERRNMIEGKPTGEDVVFFKRAREAGFKVYCDFSTRPLHIGNPQLLKFASSK